MPDPPYTVRRYLDAIRSVDDRALSPRLLERLDHTLTDTSEPWVLSIGAGLGAMVTRLLDRGILPDATRYTAIERDPELAAIARDRLRAMGTEQSPNTVAVDRADKRVTVTVETGDGFAALDRRKWDGVITQAFNDIDNLTAEIQRVTAGLTPEGAWYIPVAFDGVTGFAPAAPLDDEIEESYHQHLDTAGGTSHLGRRLITAIAGTDHRLIAIDSADRVITPTTDGYPAAEADVLRHIVESIRESLAGTDLDDSRLNTWVTRRHTEIDRAELVYVTHGLALLVGHQATE